MLQEQLTNLPDKPGVYLFKDSANRVIYVGKANSLKHRVHSYFQKEQRPNPRLQLLVEKIAHLDYILCDSEMEALLLEYNLIKENRPPFNVRFRDDKRFPLIKVVLTDPFPYITIARRRLDDGNRYFGPYVSSQSMRQTLKVIRKIFQIRSCTMKITGHDRPCLYYHLKECTAPCISAIKQDAYRKSIEGVVQFLEGKGEGLLQDLTLKMEDAANRLEFERAAYLRNQIQGLEQVMTRQKVVSEREQTEDYIGIAFETGLAAGVVFHVRGGVMIGKDEYVFESVEPDASSTLWAFIEKYYQDHGAIPKRILTSTTLPQSELMQELLSQKAGFHVELETPQRGEKKKMFSLLEKNASHRLELARLKEVRSQGMMEALNGLKELFGLPTLPFRIEGYDISTLFGQQSVGSMVVFQGGKPEKKQYRKFSVQSKGAPDDFAMMEEMLTRRFQRLSSDDENDEDESFSTPPDLILLDGGRGQLSVGVKVLAQTKHSDIPIVSLAKQEEEIYHPQLARPLKLVRTHSGLKLLQHVRDEAHRFAVTYHKLLRGKKMTQSTLSAIPGIGEKRTRKLFEVFGSLDQVKVATPEQIAKALRCSSEIAEKILTTVSE